MQHPGLGALALAATLTAREGLVAAAREPPAAEAKPRSTFNVGLTLMVTAEPNGGQTDVGINAIPVVLEWTPSTWIGVRARALFNAQIAGTRTGWAQRGGGVLVPFYLSSRDGPHAGWYVGPYGAYSTNPLAEGRDTTVALAGGYRWKLATDWLLDIEAEAGASYLTAGGGHWVQHIGVYPSVGHWLF